MISPSLHEFPLVYDRNERVISGFPLLHFDMPSRAAAYRVVALMLYMLLREGRHSLLSWYIYFMSYYSAMSRLFISMFRLKLQALMPDYYFRLLSHLTRLYFWRFIDFKGSDISECFPEYKIYRYSLYFVRAYNAHRAIFSPHFSHYARACTY